MSTTNETEFISEIIIGVAFDNYDRYVETLTGKDTLHDTVGIAYQDDIQSSLQDHDGNTAGPSVELLTVPEVQSGRKSVRRRRAYGENAAVIEPYHKRPRMVKEIMIPMDDPRRKDIPATLHQAKLLDFIWASSLSVNPKPIPMWTGWNATFLKDDALPRLPMQTISYLPQLNVSPTSISAVVETLNMSKRIAEECDQKYVPVTYDLAIANVALTIQSEESPKFDNLFIQLGSFHIELSLFKAIGKFIDDSGGPYILRESSALAEGSLDAFLSGKHYNRCKRIHPIFAAALRKLHFEEFLKTLDHTFIEEYKIIFSTLKPISTLADISMEIQELFERYELFCKKTTDGEHGATAKYWMIYIKLIDLYHHFVRSIRTEDYKLFIYLLPEITNLFFIFNHQNYARWLTRYHDNLMKMEETHPGISEYFESGIISIRRTTKPF